MLAINDIKVPDIGDFKDVPVIEIHVQPGAKVSVDDPLVSLESDKATMDVPATQAGTVEEVLIKIGDRVSEGVPILRLRAEEAAGDAPVTPPPSVIAQQEPAPQPRQAAPPPPQPGSPTARPAALGRFRRSACGPLRPALGTRARGRSGEAERYGGEGPDHRRRT